VLDLRHAHRRSVIPIRPPIIIIAPVLVSRRSWVPAFAAKPGASIAVGLGATAGECDATIDRQLDEFFGPVVD
jgi:hypothetical protein